MGLAIHECLRAKLKGVDESLKRLFISVFALLLCAALSISAAPVWAAPTPTPTPAAKETAAPDPASLSCASAVLMDASSGDIVFSKEPNKRVYPASTTKIMTVLLLLENKKLTDVVQCGREVNAFNSGPNGSSLVGLKQNERVTVKDLVYGMLLASGNDAAAAAAVAVSGSQDAFVTKMNQKARALGLNGTHYENPHGLHDDNHYTTARDMATLARVALQNETIAAAAATDKYTIPTTNLTKSTRELINTNRLVASKTEADKKFLYQYANGLKTGSTPKAGNCLVASAKKGSASYIAAIFDDPSADGSKRWSIAKTLFDYGFSADQGSVETANRSGDPEVYSIIEGITLKEQVSGADQSDTQNGMLELDVKLDDAQVTALSAETVTAIKTSPSSIEATKNFTKALSAPIKKGDTLGTVTYAINNQPFLTGTLVASRSVPATGGADASQPGYVVEPPTESGFPVLWVVIPAVLLLIILLRIMSRRRSARRRRRRVSRRRTTYYNF